jgi:hypothetical protein
MKRDRTGIQGQKSREGKREKGGVETGVWGRTQGKDRVQRRGGGGEKTMIKRWGSRRLKKTLEQGSEGRGEP